MEWIVRFVRFHSMRSREDLFPAEPTIESCLTDLAVKRIVAAATQHQAMYPLVFLDTRVLNHALEGHINAVRADKQINVPVVMTPEAVAAVISLRDGTTQLVATRLYESGLRIMEAVQLRGKAVDGQMTPLTVRAGKGTRTGAPLFPPRSSLCSSITWPASRRDLSRIRLKGHGEVDRPQALPRTSPPTAKAWGWPYVVPAWDISVDPRSGVTHRHHVDPSVIHKAIMVAVRRAGLTKTISAHTFRHAFATHLLQRGTDIRTIQPGLEHNDRATTMIDTHILQPGGQGVPSPLDDLGV